MALARTRTAQLCALILALALALLAILGSPLQSGPAGAAGCAEIRDRPVSIDANQRTVRKDQFIDRHGTVTTSTRTVRGPVDSYGYLIVHRRTTNYKVAIEVQRCTKAPRSFTAQM